MAEARLTIGTEEIATAVKEYIGKYYFTPVSDVSFRVEEVSHNPMDTDMHYELTGACVTFKVKKK